MFAVKSFWLSGWGVVPTPSAGGLFPLPPLPPLPKRIHFKSCLIIEGAIWRRLLDRVAVIGVLRHGFKEKMVFAIAVVKRLRDKIFMEGVLDLDQFVLDLEKRIHALEEKPDNS